MEANFEINFKYDIKKYMAIKCKEITVYATHRK